MINDTPVDSVSGRYEWLHALVGTALACSLAFLFMHLSDRKITPMWPAVGIAVACIQVYGNRIALPTVVGYMTIWLFLKPPVYWWMAFLPFVFLAEALIISWLVKLTAAHVDRNWQILKLNAGKLAGAAFLGCSISAFALSSVSASSGYFFPFNPQAVFFWVMMSHVQGIVSFGPLTVHLLNKDFKFEEIRSNRLSLLAALAVLLAMGLSFFGVYARWMDQMTAIILLFPILVVLATRLPPALTAFMITLWCVTSAGLNCLGEGHLSRIGEVVVTSVTDTELGIFNIVISIVIYMISVESTRMRRQTTLNRSAMEATSVVTWEWDQQKGLTIVAGIPNECIRKVLESKQSAWGLLGKLCGLDLPTEVLSENWRHSFIASRESIEPTTVPDLECVGQVLHRNKNNCPEQAIGFLIPLTNDHQVEKVLRGLDYHLAQLKSLQRQLNPHFLFNSLNVIRALLHLDIDRAELAILALAKLLRANLKSADKRLIPLAVELEQIRALLSLAQLRFEDRLVSTIAIPDSLLGQPIPPMLLLNLVENAITHGIGKLANGGFITVSAVEDSDKIYITIRNSGCLSKNAVWGNGIRDASQRLELLFGGRAQFKLIQLDQSTVSADLILPNLTNHSNATLDHTYLPNR